MSYSSFTHKARAGLAAVSLAIASLAPAGSAHAASDALGSLTALGSTFEVGIGAPFIDTLTFTLDTDVTASFVAAGEGFSIPGLFTLTGSPDVTFAVYYGAVDLTGWGTSFTDLSLLAGDYSFKVKGSTGGYTVTWATAPVTEPATLALTLGGLAVAGFVSRRRARAR